VADPPLSSVLGPSRVSLAPVLRDRASTFPVVTLTGPRQSGKSTLCRELFPGLAYVNLEAPDVRRAAVDDPRAFLRAFTDRPNPGAILDEVQRAPELLSYLQVLVDDDPTPGRWIVTGSQHLQLLSSVSQSLAGRTAVLQLLPMHRDEVRQFAQHPTTLDDTLLAGGYPRIFDAGLAPSTWLSAYVATYIERDVRTIADVGDLVAFQRFVELCAGRTAQLLNLSSLAADAGIAQPTAKAWLSILEASFLTFRLPPLARNIGKRLGKMPKLHFIDSGLVCWLLGIRDRDQLARHPLRGAIFETWVVSEILKRRTARGELLSNWRGMSFYREQGGLEADLVVEEGGELTVVEMKSGATPSSDMLASARRVAERLSGPRSGPGSGPVSEGVGDGREEVRRGSWRSTAATTGRSAAMAA
jgi:predicted AAA+ superfamily ATPase